MPAAETLPLPHVLLPVARSTSPVAWLEMVTSVSAGRVVAPPPPPLPALSSPHTRSVPLEPSLSTLPAAAPVAEILVTVMAPAPILLVVMAPAATWSEPTALSAMWLAVMASSAIFEPLTASLASFAVVTLASPSFAVVTAPAPSFASTTAPSTMTPEPTALSAILAAVTASSCIPEVPTAPFVHEVPFVTSACPLDREFTATSVRPFRAKEFPVTMEPAPHWSVAVEYTSTALLLGLVPTFTSRSLSSFEAPPAPPPTLIPLMVSPLDVSCALYRARVSPVSTA